MRKFLSLLLTMAMVLSLAVTVNAAAPKEDITILHTNDVHCDYEKYAKVATLHKSADLLVDAGDHVQGDVIGTLSKGEYIVDIMNYIKYDAAVPGNHEFDYGMDQFLHIAKDLAKYPYLSANFTGKDGTPYFDAYKIFEVKGVKVAFVGVCTPETFTKSTPTYFQDANGNYIYGFCEGNNGADLYKAVQKAIDAAKAAGADYVIGLGHLGIDEQSSPWTSKEVIANTTGFDAFIDGHSHSTFSETIKDKSGKEVVFEQTGTKLANVGKIIIKADGTITHENVDLNTVEPDAEAASARSAMPRPTSATCARTPTASCWALTSPSSTAAACATTSRSATSPTAISSRSIPSATRPASLRSPVSRSRMLWSSAPRPIPARAAASCRFPA